MYTRQFQQQVPAVRAQSGAERDIHGTKRQDIFLSPSPNFSSYFREIAVMAHV